MHGTCQTWSGSGRKKQYNCRATASNEQLKWCKGSRERKTRAIERGRGRRERGGVKESTHSGCLLICSTCRKWVKRWPETDNTWLNFYSSSLSSYLLSSPVLLPPLTPALCAFSPFGASSLTRRHHHLAEEQTHVQYDSWHVRELVLPQTQQGADGRGAWPKRNVLSTRTARLSCQMAPSDLISVSCLKFRLFIIGQLFTFSLLLLHPLLPLLLLQLLLTIGYTGVPQWEGGNGVV